MVDKKVHEKVDEMDKKVDKVDKKADGDFA